MSDHKKASHPAIFRVVLILLPIVLICSLAFFFTDRMISFSVDRFTEYRFSYAKWRGNPFGVSEIRGLCLEMKGKGITIDAEKVRLDFDALKFLKGRQVDLGCEMEEVLFSPEVKTETPPPPAKDVLAALFSAAQKYEEVRFKLFLGKGILKIRGFEARSKDVRIKGEYTFFERKEEIDLDLKVSFSPEFSSVLAEDIRERVLSLDEDGWYSTVINYKGNPLFLKALYSLAF